LEKYLAFTDIPKTVSSKERKEILRTNTNQGDNKTTNTTTIRRLEQLEATAVTPEVLPEVFVRALPVREANVRALTYKQKEQNSAERATILTWETTPTLATLVEAQEADEHISQLLKIVSDHKEGKTRVKVPKFRLYYVKDSNGILRVTTKPKGTHEANEESKLPLVVPKTLQHRLIYYYHNSLWAMHMGWRKGAALLQKAFFWIGMVRDLKEHVNKCLQCRQAKTTQPRRQGLTKLFFRTGPFECIHVDFVGPLGKADGRWEYVFTVIDAFSRWVHLIPVPDETAHSAARALVERVITVHGCPVTIVSDQGGSFKSNLWNELGKILKINLSLAKPRHPQTNGAAERIHRTLNAALRAAATPKDNWLRLTPFIEWAYRTTPIEGIGLSPFQILYGRDPVMPPEIQFMNREAKITEEADITDYVKQAKMHISAAQQLVKQADRVQKQKAKARRDIGRTKIELKIGDKVIIYMPKSLKDIPQRRIIQWTGVCTVTKKIAENSYEVRRDDKNNCPLESYNVDRLVPVPSDTQLLEPELDKEDEMHGLLQMPDDYTARKEAWELKRTNREQERVIAERPQEQQQPQQSLPKERKHMSRRDQPQAMELLAKDLKRKSWKQMQVGDKALVQNGKRWLPVQVLKIMNSGKTAKVQFMWTKRGTSPADNATVDWAPLWRNTRRVDQRCQWTKPTTEWHVPYTEECKSSTLRYIGLQLQSYALTPTGTRRFRIHPVWWALLKKNSRIFRALAVNEQ